MPSLGEGGFGLTPRRGKFVLLPRGKGNELSVFFKAGIHFTQPTIRCNMWPWKVQNIRFPGLIIPEHSRSLMNGLVEKMLALIILSDFDDQKVSVVTVAGVLLKSQF